MMNDTVRLPIVGVRAFTIVALSISLPYQAQALNYVGLVDPMTRCIGAAEEISGPMKDLIWSIKVYQGA